MVYRMPGLRADVLASQGIDRIAQGYKQRVQGARRAGRSSAYEPPARLIRSRVIFSVSVVAGYVRDVLDSSL